MKVTVSNSIAEPKMISFTAMDPRRAYRWISSNGSLSVEIYAKVLNKLLVINPERNTLSWFTDEAGWNRFVEDQNAVITLDFRN